MLLTVGHLGFGFNGIDRRMTTRKGRKSFLALNRFRRNARGLRKRKISRFSRILSRNGFMDFRFTREPQEVCLTGVAIGQASQQHVSEFGYSSLCCMTEMFDSPLCFIRTPNQFEAQLARSSGLGSRPTLVQPEGVTPKVGQFSMQLNKDNKKKALSY